MNRVGPIGPWPGPSGSALQLLGGYLGVPLYQFEFNNAELDLLKLALGTLEQEMTQKEYDQFGAELLLVKGKIFKTI